MTSQSEPPADAAGSAISLKQFHVASCEAAADWVAHYWFEARIDFADVRSGLMETCTVCRGLEICPLDDDVLWTKDMVVPLDLEVITPGAPPGGATRQLPGSVATETAQRLESRAALWLMRYFERRLYRNAELHTYSHPTESFEEFQLRCSDLLSESCRHVLDDVREQFERKLDRIKENYLRDERAGEFDRERVRSRVSSRIHDSSEHMTELFLSSGILADDPLPSHPPVGPGDPDYEEELRTLEAEACVAIARVLSDFRERARNIVDHVVHPTLRGVHVVRAGIVWLPITGGDAR